MAELDTSIYRNQPNPLGSAQGVFNLLNTAQQNQLLQTATQQRQLELQQGFANDLRSSLAPLANKPGLTQAEVKAALADRARQIGAYGLPAYNIAVQRYSGPDWQKNFNIDAVQSLGPESLGQRRDITNLQTGGTRSVPLAATIGSEYPTSTPPGFTQLATGAGGAGGIEMMQAVANEAPLQKTNLANLNALSDEAISGPSSDFEKRANALALRLFGTGVTMTAKQLASSEEYGKITEQVAGQQAAAAHPTNAFLTNAYNTNPSLYLSKIGRQGITHMLQGNLDSIVAKNNEWNKFANGEVDGRQHFPAEFTTWNRKFNSDFNPRVFQYARMTPEERAGFRKADPSFFNKKFADDLRNYQARGWIDMTGQ